MTMTRSVSAVVVEVILNSSPNTGMSPVGGGA